MSGYEQPIRPTVVISFDVELAWGWGAFETVKPSEVFECARWTHDFGIPVLLSHLSRTELSATWAMVGLAMYDRLLPIDDLVEVRPEHFPKPRLDLVPRRATEAEAPEWFGASVLQKIRDTTPVQEIGFHSFSHVMIAEPGTPSQRARQELERCVAAARQLGFAADSFVFPWNSVGYLEMLRDLGFRSYRSEDRLRYDLLPFLKSSSLVGLLADVLGGAPQVVHASVRNGLVDIPGSLMVRGVEGWRGLIPDTLRLQRLRKGLERVCAEGGVFHVWLHPENLYEGRPRLERILAQFMDEARALIDKGKLRCLTMGQLAYEVLHDESPLQFKIIARGSAGGA